MIQKTEWGHIEWLHKCREDTASFSVGITSLLRGKRMLKHVHYGIEQFIYILEGEGIYYINEEKKYIHKDMCFYMKPDIVHETINIGSETFKELVVSRPVSYDSGRKLEEDYLNANQRTSRMVSVNIIYSAVEAIRSPLLESISLPFTIYDDMGEIIIQSSKFSDYCTSKCNPVCNSKTCSCMLQRNFDKLDKSAQFTCEHGLTVFSYPVIYNGLQLGTISGGHILVSDYTTKGYDGHDDLYDSPESTVIGIKSLLEQIVKSITSYCSFYESRMLIEKKDKDIKEEIRRNETLRNNLYIINDKVTNLRINHHFLFNTLNSIASMALTGDRSCLYNSIIDLSKMFRYTMTVDLRFVTLMSEIEYLETYLNLQRLRYGQDLEVLYHIEKGMDKIKVPFNFIQPVVENAFTHGFIPSDNKKLIRISVEKVDDKAEIVVSNNGVLLDDITLNRVNRGLYRNTGHGLSMIYEKLKLAYSDDFSMNITSSSGDDTKVSVKIPIVYEEERA